MFEKLLNIDTQLTLLLNGSESTMLDWFALTATATSTWLPLAVLLLYVVIRGNKWQNVLIVILSIALAITLADQLASGVCKPLVARLRPSQDPLLSGVIDIVGDYRGGRYGEQGAAAYWLRNRNMQSGCPSAAAGTGAYRN